MFPTRLAVRESVAKNFTVLCLSWVLASLAVLAPVAVYGADKDQALVAKYRQAHQTRNITDLMALVHWAGAVERTREIIQQRLVLHLDLEIETIEFRPITGDQPFRRHGFHSNLEPVGWLAIFFKPPAGDSRMFAKSFVVGEKDGEYFITIARPAP